MLTAHGLPAPAHFIPEISIDFEARPGKVLSSEVAGMNPFSIASLFACVAYSFLLGYHLPRSRTMRAERPLCFVLACFTLYSGAYIFLFGSPNIDSAFFWYKVSSLGWCLFPGALFLFVYSLVKGKLPRWGTAAALLPGAALAVPALWGKVMAGSFRFVEFAGFPYWYPVLDAHPLMILYLCYIIVSLTQALLLLGVWTFRAGGPERNVRALLFGAGVCVFLLNMTTNALLPFLGFASLPDRGHLTSLVFFIAVFFAASRKHLPSE